MASEHVWSLPSQCYVEALELKDGWVTVRYPDGSIGTVPMGTLIREPDKFHNPLSGVREHERDGETLDSGGAA